MTAEDYIVAARVPHTLEPQSFGLWTIRRDPAPTPQICLAAGIEPVGFPDYVLLCRWTVSSMMHDRGEIVMEDSRHELRQHLPIWMHAAGDVLVTGLGLGCTLRGLLANPMVRHVDVVEIDEQILLRVGREFAADPRVSLFHGDALTRRWSRDKRWDWAWHDLWQEEDGLAVTHARLMKQLRGRIPTGHQGAWGFDRKTRQRLVRSGSRILGVPRPIRMARAV